MNTPAHLLIAGAVAGRSHTRLVGWAMLGGLLPDLSLYILAGVSLVVLRLPEQVVFNELYFSAAWQKVFAIDNSAVLWALALGLAFWAGRRGLLALCAGALLHIACDLPLHAGGGRAHFWPLTAWVFDSPFSYWDRLHGATWIAPLKALLAGIAAAWLLVQRGWVRWVALSLVLAELWVVRQWLFVFAT